MSNVTAEEEAGEDTGAIDGIVTRLNAIEGRKYVLAFYGFLLIWLLYLLGTSLPWRWTDKLFPLIAGVPALVLILMKIAKYGFPERYEALKPEVPTPAGDEEAESTLEETYQELREGADAARPRKDQIAYSLRMISWALALPLLMYLIGFSNALPLFIFAFGLRFYDSLRQTVLVTVVFTTLMFGFFYVIMKIPLWNSALGVPSLAKLLGIA
ncbi:MAG: tripartite tricarboxylate transporter TctB family protein [Haloferacaceae archaeon]